MSSAPKLKNRSSAGYMGQSISSRATSSPKYWVHEIVSHLCIHQHLVGLLLVKDLVGLKLVAQLVGTKLVENLVGLLLLEELVGLLLAEQLVGLQLVKELAVLKLIQKRRIQSHGLGSIVVRRYGSNWVVEVRVGPTRWADLWGYSRVRRDRHAGTDTTSCNIKEGINGYCGKGGGEAEEEGDE